MKSLHPIIPGLNYPSWFWAQLILHDDDVDSGLAFRKFLCLQLVGFALALPGNQSALLLPVSSTLHHVLACNSKTVGLAGTFDCRNENKNVSALDWLACSTNAQ